MSEAYYGVHVMTSIMTLDSSSAGSSGKKEVGYFSPDQLATGTALQKLTVLTESAAA